MRIAVITDTYAPEINGVVTSIEAHSRLLAVRGHDVLIFAPKYPESSATEPAVGVRVERFPAFSFATNRATRVALPSLVSVVTKLRRFGPDVVHVHTPLTLGVVGLLAAKALRLPTVETYHTYLPDFMQYVEPRRLLGIDDLQSRIMDSIVLERVLESGLWQRIIRSRALLEERTDEFVDALIGISEEVAEERPELTARVAWRYTRLLYNRADLVLTPSITLKRELLHHGITVPVDHLSNGIDTSVVVPKESYERTGRIIHAGRLGHEKNVEVVVKAYARIAAAMPDLILDIAGDGPARPGLERLVDRLGLGGRVRFLGFLDRRALGATYREYDCFVTASTIETQGIVLLEAMAAGLPVAGVRALAIPEIVRSGRNGIIVAPHDVQSLARAMERLTSEDALRERFGRACRADVRQHALGAVVARLESLYRETVAAAEA